MDIPLTWDLVILAAIAMTFAYHFILGHKDTSKLLICIYISILVADGVAQCLKRYVIDLSPGLTELTAPYEDGFMMWFRIIIFMLGITIFVIRSGFHVHVEMPDHWLIRLFTHAMLAGVSSVLLVATMLVYVAGISFVDGLANGANMQLFENSIIAPILIQHLQVWFSLPALVFLLVSVCLENKEA